MAKYEIVILDGQSPPGDWRVAIEGVDMSDVEINGFAEDLTTNPIGSLALLVTPLSVASITEVDISRSVTVTS